MYFHLYQCVYMLYMLQLNFSRLYDTQGKFDMPM